jgi:hypothetical protein
MIPAVIGAAGPNKGSRVFLNEGYNMAEESKIIAKVQDRREFVKTAAKVAVTAPAAAMLLNASVKPAKAAEPLYGDTGDPYNTAGHDDARQSDDGIFGDDGATPGDFVP